MAAKGKGLTENELSILKVLWEEGSPLSRPEILKRMPDIAWNPNSIHLILNSMIKKGELKVEGLTRCGRGYGRTYTPVRSQEEYIVKYANDVMSNRRKEERITGVMAAMMDANGIDADLIDELEAMLEKKKGELGIL